PAQMEILGQVHLAHAAASEHGNDAVAGKLRSRADIGGHSLRPGDPMFMCLPPGPVFGRFLPLPLRPGKSGEALSGRGTNSRLAVASKRRAEPKPLIVSIRGFGSTKALSLWDAVPGRCSRAGPPRDEGR